MWSGGVHSRRSAEQNIDIKRSLNRLKKTQDVRDLWDF
jgi:hypothetical protein